MGQMSHTNLKVSHRSRLNLNVRMSSKTFRPRGMSNTYDISDLQGSDAFPGPLGNQAKAMQFNKYANDPIIVFEMSWAQEELLFARDS